MKLEEKNLLAEKISAILKDFICKFMIIQYKNGIDYILNLIDEIEKDCKEEKDEKIDSEVEE